MKRALLAVLLFTASLYGACSAYKESFIVNELNTKGNWVELYANPLSMPPASVNNWSVTVCDNSAVCSTIAFDFSLETEGFYYILDYNSLMDLHAKSFDVLVKDDGGNVVDYLALSFESTHGPNPQPIYSDVQQSQADSCGFNLADTPGKYYDRNNTGQRDFYRVPDGTGGWSETNWQNDTNDATNDGGNTPVSVTTFGDFSDYEGDSGNTPFSFALTLNQNVTSPLYIAYRTVVGTADASDYVAQDAILTIPTGQSAGSVVIQVKGDTLPEGDEAFSVQLYQISAGTIVDNTGNGIILDDDTAASFAFDVWDTAIGSDCANLPTQSDRNITTRIAGAPLDGLTLFSLDPSNPLQCLAYDKDLNWTVVPTSACAAIASADLASIGVVPLQTYTAGGSWQSTPLSLLATANTTAYRDVSIAVQWENNQSCSSDSFAVRPDRFVFDTSLNDANLTAEHAYTGFALTAALSGSDTATPGYDNTLSPTATKRMRNNDANSSLYGTLTSSLSAFSDGAATLDLRFTDVLKMTLSLVDEEWAVVDAADTALQQRRVYGEANVTFIPHHFELLFAATPRIENGNNANGFTYLSNDVNTSAWVRGLDLTATAKGEDNATLRNYGIPQSLLFSNNVTVTPVLELPSAHSAPLTASLPSAFNNVDLNFTLGVADINFSDVRFNYARLFDEPVNPFIILGGDTNASITIRDMNYTSVTGEANASLDGNATFYFGRLRTKDIETTQSPALAQMTIELYDDNASIFVGTLTRNSLNWYANAWHDIAADGNVSALYFTDTTLLSSMANVKATAAYAAYANGRLTWSLTPANSAVPLEQTAHLQIPEWLWYMPKGLGGEYNASLNSDCGTHPCFNYRYLIGIKGRIESGDFKGSDFNTEESNVTTFRGRKLFR